MHYDANLTFRILVNIITGKISDLCEIYDVLFLSAILLFRVKE